MLRSLTDCDADLYPMLVLFGRDAPGMRRTPITIITGREDPVAVSNFFLIASLSLSLQVIAVIQDAIEQNNARYADAARQEEERTNRERMRQEQVCTLDIVRRLCKYIIFLSGGRLSRVIGGGQATHGGEGERGGGGAREETA